MSQRDRERARAYRVCYVVSLIKGVLEKLTGKACCICWYAAVWYGGRQEGGRRQTARSNPAHRETEREREKETRTACTQATRSLCAKFQHAPVGASPPNARLHTHVRVQRQFLLLRGCIIVVVRSSLLLEPLEPEVMHLVTTPP